MPQEIRVLCCFKCKTFQVDIVKKANKWQCKLCGEKQSVFKEFLRGTGAECRQKVQELNLCKNVERLKEENELLDLLENNDLEVDMELAARGEQSHVNQSKPTESKWTKYLGDSKEDCSEFIPVVQCKNIKRKHSSNYADTKNFKCSKSTSPKGSKWDTYL